MTPQNIRAAITEAKRFVRAAELALACEKADEDSSYRTYPLAGSKASGATRRASLDLTRALAEMRKP
jgi:hypothetical protein